MSRYQRRVSGPLMDRIDLFADVPRVDLNDLTAERSEGGAGAPHRARERQARRFTGTSTVINAEVGPNQVRLACPDALVPEVQPLLQSTMWQIGLSARAFHRVLKVARTVADLAGSDRIEAVHVAEAIQYRRRGAD